MVSFLDPKVYIDKDSDIQTTAYQKRLIDKAIYTASLYIKAFLSAKH